MAQMWHNVYPMDHTGPKGGRWVLTKIDLDLTTRLIRDEWTKTGMVSGGTTEPNNWNTPDKKKATVSKGAKVIKKVQTSAKVIKTGAKVETEKVIKKGKTSANQKCATMPKKGQGSEKGTKKGNVLKKANA